MKDTEIYGTFISSLTRICMDRSITVRKLAKMTGLSDYVVQAVMQQQIRPDLPMALKISEALEVPIEVMCDDGKLKPHTGSFRNGIEIKKGEDK